MDLQDKLIMEDNRTYELYLGSAGIPLGQLNIQYNQNQINILNFNYHDSWLKNPDNFPLSPDLPLINQKLSFFLNEEKPLPACLLDLCPEQWGRNLIDHYHENKNEEINNPHLNQHDFDYLLHIPDFYRLGALRIKPYQSASEYLALLKNQSNPQKLNFNQLAQLIRSYELKDNNITNFIQELTKIGTSLGGTRPKCTILDQDHQLWLAKFTSKNDILAVEKAEILTLRIAELCNINVPENRLINSEQPIALTKRFDRFQNQRRHYLSAKSMLSHLPKFHPSYLDLVQAMKEICLDPQKDLKELFTRLTLYLLVSNTDDHFKNHGFLHIEKGKYELSPMFDVNPNPLAGPGLWHPIANTGHTTLEELLKQANHFELTKDNAIHLINKTARTINKNWRIVGQDLGMTDQELEDYRLAFEHSEMDFALKLSNKNHRIVP